MGSGIQIEEKIWLKTPGEMAVNTRLSIQRSLRCKVLADSASARACPRSPDECLRGANTSQSEPSRRRVIAYVSGS